MMLNHEQLRAMSPQDLAAIGNHRGRGLITAGFNGQNLRHAYLLSR